MTEPWVIVSGGFHFSAGQAKAVAWLADYLARTGHPIHLVGNQFDSAFLDRPGVSVHWLPRVRGADVIGNLMLARAGRAIARMVTTAYPDARVVVNGANCVWADINWVHYLHTAWQPNLSMAPKWFRAKERAVVGWYRSQERRAIRAARVVVANSARTARDVVASAGCRSVKVRTVYYGSDPAWAPATAAERTRGREQFDLPINRPVVAFVGGFGFDNRKGFDTLLEAWAILSADPVWDAALVLAGGGRATAKVADRIKAFRNVQMLGFTDNVYDLLAGVDVLVSPVRYEPYGLNVQEAISRGLPAVVSRVAGVAEEYPLGLAGALLDNPDDPAQLAAVLRAWRADMPGWRARFARLSDRLRARTWDDMAREFVEVVRR